MDTVERALESITLGKMVVVVDDPGRENEGDLVMAADAVSPDAVNFMATHGRGLICFPMEGQLLDRLQIGPMVPFPRGSAETPFTISIDLEVPGSTGISAFDRARTIRAAIAPGAAPADFRRPGHVFPLRYTEGGVLVRRGHTEAAVDLARLAHRHPGGVICEIMAKDGTMARGDNLLLFADEHGLPVVSIEELVAYRLRQDASAVARDSSSGPPELVQRCVETNLPTRYGRWRAIGYQSREDGSEQMALVLGELDRHPAPLVRIHSECLTGDVFHSRRCDCGDQLDSAMTRIASEGVGTLVYVRGHEGRGIGLINKLCAYALQDRGRDTVDANLALGLPIDARKYRMAAAILNDLGLRSVRLLTDNPDKVTALTGEGIAVDRVSLAGAVTADNAAYLATKRKRLGHLSDATGEQPRTARLPSAQFVTHPSLLSEKMI